jgi:23S rRNA G2069 N7-methylase RlmK/C1962 C5-methylase RlmI
VGEWKLERDLPELLGLAGDLLEPGGLLALTCHSEGWGEGRLSGALRESGAFTEIGEEPLFLDPETPRGKALPGGLLAIARTRPL